MNILTRRLVALAATGTLVSVPALTLIGGGAAQAATRPTSSVAAPAGLVDGLTGVVSGLLGGLTGGSTPPTDPTQLLDTIVSTVTAATGGDPADVTTTLTGLLTSGGDPTTTLTSVVTLLTGGVVDSDLQSTLDGLTSAQVGSLVGELTSGLPISTVFPGGLPDPITAILATVGTSLNPGAPTSDLISALTDLYNSQGTQPSSQVQGALPSSLLQLLLAGLAHTPGKTSQPTPVAHAAAPVAHPSSRCRLTTAKVKTLQKRLKSAKKHHHTTKARALKKKLAKAKRAKRLAC